MYLQLFFWSQLISYCLPQLNVYDEKQLMMKTTLVTLLFSLLSILLYGQQQTAISIWVHQKKQASIGLEQLRNLPQQQLDSLRIYNHAGSYRSTLQQIKGVLLKDILKEVRFGEGSPKELSEYYLIAKAKDGYKVVFSWNELFNSPLGDKVLLVTNISQASQGKQKDGFALLSPKDIATGRRYVKDLESIQIRRIDNQHIGEPRKRSGKTRSEINRK